MMLFFCIFCSLRHRVCLLYLLLSLFVSFSAVTDELSRWPIECPRLRRVSVCPPDALEILMLALKLIFSCVCSPQNGRDYGFLVQQNSELLRALEEMEKSCNALREDNRILVRSPADHQCSNISTELICICFLSDLFVQYIHWKCRICIGIFIHIVLTF